MVNPTLQSLRHHAQLIFQEGVAAADPYSAVANCLNFKDDTLEIRLNDQTVRSGHWTRVHLLAFGKAAGQMLKAAQKQIPVRRQKLPNVIVTNYENVKPLQDCRVIGASHPLPNEDGLTGAKLIAERVASAQQDELVIVLISGGGSALLPYPVDGVNLHDKITTTRRLLSCGASINEINCVRKHLSRLKGGRLAELCPPADLHALILSDVIGDDLSSIASGPTVPDDTRYEDAVDILQKYGILTTIPSSVRTFLQAGSQGKFDETPKHDHPCFNNASHTLVGSNRMSVHAISACAEKLGYDTYLYSDKLTGEARLEAEKLAQFAKYRLQQSKSGRIAILAGGETTVTLSGSGLGGRNQEMALAFAIAADKHDLNAEWVFLSGGTDGRDGPTEAAGGLVDTQTLNRIDNPVGFLDNNDSFNALKQANDLLITGATGTNVADLQVLLVQSE